MTMVRTKSRRALLLGGAAGLVFYLTNRSGNESSLFFPGNLDSILQGVARSSRAVAAVATIAADYKYSLHDIPDHSEEYRRELSKVHLRSSMRIRKLCEMNKGFYVKAGQFVAAMRQVPKEYSSTLSSLQDKVVPCDFEAVREVLLDKFGPHWSEKFLSFDEQPIAAASIAQVHRARLLNQQEVAVKVQYPGLEKQMKVDIMAMSFISNTVSLIFPQYRFGWLVSQFIKSISDELDFISEAENCERTAKNFRTNKMITVPNIYWELTTKNVLTMQFCDGCKIDDAKFLREKGINPKEVAKAMLKMFAEMIFIHGFVHGDPHPGNILVAQDDVHGFRLVLLDHGIYNKLDDETRQIYCELWRAMIRRDSESISQIGQSFGVPKYAKYFPVIFTGRTLQSKAAVGGAMSSDEKRALKNDLKTLKMTEINSFVEALPSHFLSILRIDGLLRSISTALGLRRNDRVLIYAKFALFGRNQKSNSQLGFRRKLADTFDYVQMRILLDLLDSLSWVEAAKHLLLKFFSLIACPINCFIFTYKAFH